ncbi:MAG: ABC transporter permease [Polyangiaceae bacterium]|nr:ABC transporter permease [Polyangiaceae bacterium]
MPEPLHPLLELIRTRLREFYREPAVVFWVFGFPLLMAVGLGIAFRSKPPALPMIAIVGQGPSATALVESSEVESLPYEAKEAQQALQHARVDLIVITPENEAAAGAPSDKSGAVSYIFDPLQEKGARARDIANNIIQRSAGRVDPLPSKTTQISEVGNRYIDFLIPGLIGLNLMGSSMWGVGYNLVVARKRKLLRRYAVTPMKRSHFLLAAFCSRLLFLCVELFILVTFGALAFGTKVQGSYLTLALVALASTAAFSGISLLIGARLENTETANGWMNLVQMPMWVFGGAFFSYERFPEWSHWLIELLPLAAVTNSLRLVFSGDATFALLLGPMTVLLAWAILGFGFAKRYFRWQ